MSCKLCDSPFTNCDCWKSRMNSEERILLQDAAVARSELKLDRKEFEKWKEGGAIVRGQFGNRKVGRRNAKLVNAGIHSIRGNRTGSG